MPSLKTQASWAPLISAMQESLQEEWGLKIQALCPDSRLKSAFYGVRKAYAPEFDSLSLLATGTPGVFLIYHPARKEAQDGEREEGLD